jgi:ribosome maturation factor RimP
MIDKTRIHKALGDVISGTDIFLVDITVSAANRIKILIDRPDGLGINDCVNISKAVESALDRDVQDFELEVSSPGAESVFKVPGQYLKQIGRDVEIRLLDQSVVKGTLLDYQPDSLTIRPDLKGKKKNQNMPDTLSVPISSISQVKGVISFTFK